MSDHLDLTRLIGTLSRRQEHEPRRSERKKLRRLIDDLCLIATALHEVKKEPTPEPPLAVARVTTPDRQVWNLPPGEYRYDGQSFSIPVDLRRRPRVSDQQLFDAIHSAMSWTYIDGEEAQLRTRVELKKAAGWPLTDGEEERLQELTSATTTAERSSPDSESCSGGSSS